jgi:glycolate oxidase
VTELKSALERIAGSDNVSDDDFELVCYSRGWSVEGPYPPLIIVRPENKEQVAEILRIANRVRVPVSVYGGNTELVGSHAKEAIALDITAMRGVTEIDEDSLTVTALAGTTWEEIFYELAKKGWRTGPHVHSAPSSTIGAGVVLCANGITGARYGLVGHQVVGLEVVLPNGDIFRTGSGVHPACKSFMRYAWGSDLTGLFIGSHGIFGVVTEVTLNIYPLPEVKVVHGYEYESIESAVNALHQIQRRRIPLDMVYIQVPGTIKVSFPTIRGNAALIPLVIAGTSDEVSVWEKQVDKICLKEGKEIIDAQALNVATEVSKRVQYICPDYRAFAREWDGCSMQISLCDAVPTLDFPKFHYAFENLCKEEKMEDYKIVAYCEGFACAPNAVNASADVIYDERDPKSWQKALDLARKTTARFADMGFAPQYIGRLKAIPDIMWRLGAYNEVIRTLKKAIDPNNIMNPGQLMTPEF